MMFSVCVHPSRWYWVRFILKEMKIGENKILLHRILGTYSVLEDLELISQAEERTEFVLGKIKLLSN
jgi:hypothetical protein